MVEFQGLNRSYEWWFAFLYSFRPLLKTVMILASVVILGVLVLYALKALGFVAKVVVGGDS